MNSALAGLAELVKSRSGMRIDPAHHAGLEAALTRAAPELEPSAFLALARDPAAGAEAVARLVDEVTIKETFFLRDAGQLGAIDWQQLLNSARAAGSDTVRIWSAACATGEEPYSLAMLACEAFGTFAPPVRILATDISRTALARALEGRYRARSMREVGEDLRERYLETRNGEFVVRDALRRLVSFGPHNLVADSTPPAGYSAFDLIVCRNVLIYFDSETVARVIKALAAALAPGGTLLLGAADALCDTALRLASFDSPPPQPQPQPRPRPARAAPARRTEVDSEPARARTPAPTAAERLALALRSAGDGRVDEAIAEALRVVRTDPMNAAAHFVHGLVHLSSGEPAAAVRSLRRALYIDPGCAIAAFKLGRAHEALGDDQAAVRSYKQALRALDRDPQRPEDPIVGRVDLLDVAAACRMRIEALGP